MGFFAEIFGKPKVTARELKVHLLRVERERRRKILEMRKINAKQERLVEKIKEARKLGHTMEVDYLWEDVKQLRLDGCFFSREVKILNLEGITLKKYVRGLERLERANNKEGIHQLMARIKTSGLDARLATQEINDREYLDEVTAILDEAGLQDELVEESLAEEDPAKAHFLKELDEIIQAEEEGNLEKANQKSSALKEKLEREEENA